MSGPSQEKDLELISDALGRQNRAFRAWAQAAARADGNPNDLIPAIQTAQNDLWDLIRRLNVDPNEVQKLPGWSPLPDQQTRSFELLKMEYETAAERYENVYRAMWQNFSYLSLISAAILTFGSNQLETWATVFAAGLPIAFWVWMQFIPLDAYGRDIRLRLRDIETILNYEYFGIGPSKAEKETKVAWWKRPLYWSLTAWWNQLLGKMQEAAEDAPQVRMAHFTEFVGKPRSDCWPRYSTRGGILIATFFLLPTWLGVSLALLNSKNWDLAHFTKNSAKQVHVTVDGALDAKKALHVTADGSLGDKSQASASPTVSSSPSPTPTGSASPTASSSPSASPTVSASPTSTSKNIVPPAPSAIKPSP